MWKVFDRSDTEARSEMDRFVRTHTQGHFLQTPAWADVKTCWDWNGIIVRRQGNIVASMLVLIRRLPLHISVLYAPRGPVCNRNDREIWTEIMEALRHIAKQQHAILLYTDPDEQDSNAAFRAMMRSFGFTEKTDEGFGNIQPQYVFRLSLADRSKEDILKSFSGKTRYNIGLSVRKGVTVQEFSGADPIPDAILQDFYSLMQITGQRDHFHIRGCDYFERLLRALQENARIYVAYLGAEPIAGAIEVFCGKKAWYLYGASANTHRNAMPSYLLQWTMIQRAMERGCEVYDFRGVPGNVSEADPLYGLYRFKKGFSGDYTKFTGLFLYAFHPICSGLLQWAVGVARRRLLRKPPETACPQH